MAEPEPAAAVPEPAGDVLAELAGIDPHALAPPVEGEPSSHESCGADPLGQVLESWPGTSTDPQTAPAAPTSP